MDAQHARDAKEVIENLGPACARFAGKSVLITGAGGFLGSQFVHLFAVLNDSGRLDSACTVYAWDNFLRGVPVWAEAMAARGDVHWERRDIVRPGAVPEIDFVVHAASIASPVFYRKRPIDTMDANVTGLRNLLDAATVNRVQSFLFFSSSEIYGDPTVGNVPTPETYWGNVSCTGPRACYDESKRFGETLCVNFFRMHRVPVKIVRPFNNYGPGLKISDRRVIPDFFRDVLAGRDIVILSDGRSTRTFCYASDAMTGYLLALLSDHDGEAFNIGTDDDEISMVDLAKLVIDIAGTRCRVVFGESDDPNYVTDNPKRRRPDIGKARRLLGYGPHVSLREGLTRTHAYYRDNGIQPEE
jgi:UDP-glucuronate decarboxylase